jgi:single-strand DNA-binding protein
MNHIVLIGRLTKDPELRYTPSGKAVAVGRLAVDRGTTNPQGEKETDFIDVVVWERLAESFANYKQKGDLIGVRGRLQIRQYEDQGGHRREHAEVVAAEVRFLDNRSGDRAAAGHKAAHGSDDEGGGDHVPWE